METIDSQGSLWEVFVQPKPGQIYKHAGSIHAFDKLHAIENARDVYTRRGPVSGLWVIPSSEIISVSINEAGYFFESDDDKAYRHPTFYNLPDGIKNI